MSVRNDTLPHRKALPMYVVVVESHQHVLEHIHTVLRRRRRHLPPKSSQQWSMIHYDAHPDLACPGKHIPAAACFTPRKIWPSSSMAANCHSNDERSETEQQGDDNTSDPTEEKNLYELLDSTSSGIAEWILPLVLAAELKTIHWIRPPGSLQLSMGSYNFKVGAWVPATDMERGTPISAFFDLPASAIVKVDLKHPYYLEDSAVVQTNALVLPQGLRLFVSELADPPPTSRFESRECDNKDEYSSPRTRESRQEEQQAVHAWALDICLDYFACLNPFLTDLEKVSPLFSKALMEAFTKVEFSNRDVFAINDQEYGSYEEEYIDFCDCVAQLFLAALETTNYRKGIQRNHKEGLELEGAQQSCFSKCITFYKDQVEGTLIANNLLKHLISNENPTELTTMAIEALPNVMLPHHPVDTHESLKSSVFSRVRVALEHIYRLKCRTSEESSEVECCGGEPFIITISRSSDDGFTPSSIVEELQGFLLQELHSIFCGCDNLPKLHLTDQDRSNVTPELFSQSKDCRWNIIFDYGQWEGSTFDA